MTLNMAPNRTLITLHAASSLHADAIASTLINSRKAFLPYAPFAHSEAATRAWVRDILVPGGGVTVALDRDAVVGMLAGSRGGAQSWIDQLYIAPKRVGQGIGSQLLAHALASLLKPIRLFTFQANTGSRRFYERAGFEAIKFTDGAENEERCPDVLYELGGS